VTGAEREEDRGMSAQASFASLGTRSCIHSDQNSGETTKESGTEVYTYLTEGSRSP